MNGSSLDHTPSGRWQFDETVTNCFADMLQRSIPSYDEMRKLVDAVAGRTLASSTSSVPHVLSLGCSIGGDFDRFLGDAGVAVSALDNSQPMIRACAERYDADVRKGRLFLRLWDLSDGTLPDQFTGPFDVALSILTIQFVPVESRGRLLRAIYDRVRPGGVLIVVEKVVGSGYWGPGLQELYEGFKAGNGYSPEAIEAKRRSLRNVLVPMTEDWNRDLIAAAGFDRPEPFWRALCFSGLVARRPRTGSIYGGVD